MTVDDREAHLQTHGPTIRAALVEGSYAPQPVRRTAIPKPGGGTRHLGIPTGRDRCLEPAVWQVLQEAWDPTCAERRDGVRPQRSAHQAVGQAQASIRDGDTGVGDLEQCCDRVHHEGWLRRGRRRVQDRRVLTLIHRLLNAGVLPLEGRVEPTAEGTPQGGPRSPLRDLDTWIRRRLMASDQGQAVRERRLTRVRPGAHRHRDLTALAQPQSQHRDEREQAQQDGGGAGDRLVGPLALGLQPEMGPALFKGDLD
jgi:retron-type reverse transcriptase